MSSVTNSIYDMAGAFLIAEEPDFLGPNRVWRVLNDQQVEQAAFLPLLDLVRPHVPELAEAGLLDAKVSWQAQVINEWFTERGFDIQLTDQARPDTFYAGSIYEQLVHWLVSGERFNRLVGRDGRSYPDAVRMEDGVSFYTSPECSGTIARLATEKEGDMAYMVMLDAPPTGPFGLLRLAQQIGQDAQPAYNYNELWFPMVHIDHEVDMDWLVGLWTMRDSGQRAWVSEAKQQSILKLNPQGALAKSAFGMAVTLESMVSSQPQPLAINSPFLFWIKRQGCPLPLFAAWVDYAEWKDPGELN